MFRRIVVPLDGSSRAERALPVAARLARASGGSIVLLQVVALPLTYEPALLASYVSQTPFTSGNALDTELARAGEYLARIERSALLEGLTVEIAVLTGTPASTILTFLDQKQEQPVDLVIMCRHTRTSIARWALGSVAQKIARQSPVPVLILSQKGSSFQEHLPATAPSPLRALVAVDGSSLAEAALAPTLQLVEALAPSHGTLHLVRVVALPTVASQQQNWQHILNVRAHLMQEATAYLSTLANRIRAQERASTDLQVSWSIIEDADIAEAIITLAELGTGAGSDEGAGFDLVALATHGRSGIERWMLGSITERVLTGTTLPLLLVRPQKQESVRVKADDNV